jgi:hypothetical protein
VVTFTLDSALIVGDSHADAGWFKFTVLPLAVEMGVSAIVQVGDFGYWPDAAKFLHVVRTAREKYGVDVVFFDGNHEHFLMLARDVASAQVATGVPAGSREPVELSPGVTYLPRGARLEIAGRSVAVCGGAVSLNRRDLKLGVSWFAEERINDLDIEAVARGGPADILLTHDAPSGWRIPGILSDGVIPVSWMMELPSAEEHRERVREVLEIVRPAVLIHGHYHSAYQLAHQESWGELEVFGLDCNDSRYWGVVLAEIDGDLSAKWVDAS